MKAILEALAVLVMLAGCSFDGPGPKPDNGEEWIDAAAETERETEVVDPVEPTPIKPVPEDVTPLDDMTMDELDKWLETLTPEQQMELIRYADELNVWNMNGAVPPEPEPPEWLKPYLVKPSSKAKLLKSGVASKKKQESEPVRQLGIVPPDPLAAEPTGKKKAKAGRQPEFWLFCYGGEWCQACRYDKPLVQAWANRNGLTTSEANVPDSRLSQVQFVDVTRDNVTRDLAYDKPRPAMYPTYLIVDADGRTVWKRAASRIDIEELDLVWGLLNY